MSTSPGKVIRNCLQIGVEAIVADPTVLNSIWEDQSAVDLASLKAYWTVHPPTIITGFARAEEPFPLFAILLMSETTTQDYIGVGDQAFLMGDVQMGSTFRKRVTGRFGIHVFAESPDLAAAYYRVARRILNVGTFYLIKNKLDSPKLDGQDLAPEAKYVSDNVFLRLLTLESEYEEIWPDNDALAIALMTPQPDRILNVDSVHAFHEDTIVDSIGGGFYPIGED